MFACRNCGGSDATLRFARLRDRFVGHAGEFDYVACRGCGLVQLRDTLPDLGRFYDSYPLRQRESRIERTVRRAVVNGCYLFEAGRGRRLLDVGCGNGSYLEEMRALGWDVTGLELDPGYAADLGHALGCTVLAGLDALVDHERHFDLATLNFAFEHFERPLDVLDRVARCLRPGGRIYISVPNLEGREARLFKDRWFHLDPPRHVTFFTKALLTAALASRGFAAIATRNLPVGSGFAGSLSYWTVGRFHPLVYLGLLAPGMLFGQAVRDGNFAITATLASRTESSSV